MNFQLQIKNAGAQGAFDANKTYEAVAWDSSIVDRQGDKFDASTFDLSVLKKHPLPLLFNHDSTKIAGAIDEAEVVGGKLLIKFRLADTELGNEMAKLIAAEALNTLSVGFIARKTNGGVVVRELMEVSLTPTPANSNAVITQRSINTQTSGETQMSGIAINRSKSEQENYSVSRFLLGLADPMQAKHAGFEFEVSRELARLSGKSADSAMIPYAALAQKTAQDSLTTGNPNVGASLALPVSDPSMFLATSAATFKNSIAARAGINFHAAPSTSEYKIPRMVESVVANWVQRDTALQETNAMFDTVSATPHTVGGLTRIMRSALLDCRPDMEQLIVGELRKAINDAIDSAVLGGKGASNAPKGLLDLIITTGPIADAQDLLELIRQQKVTDDNGALALLTGFGFNQWAMSRPISSSLNQVPLMQGGAINGNGDVRIVDSAKLDLDATGAVASDIPVLLGQTAYCHLVTFGGVEVAVNPYSESDWNRGSLLCRTIADIDFLCTDASRWTRGEVTLG